MSDLDNLTRVFNTAPQLPLDDRAKIIIFSDCHRGDNSWADDFAHNQNLYYFALNHYLAAGFTYIEAGDGDELWENRDFNRIRVAHSHVFWLLRQFHLQQRLHLIWGNHDYVRRDPRVAQAMLGRYYDTLTRREEPLLEGIVVHEGVVLHHLPTDGRILVTHGHQVDPLHYRWAWLAGFVVRHFWRHLQLLGVHDPTSPAQNPGRRSWVEDRLTAWVQATGRPLFVGHTHRPRFAAADELPYFNAGSCVHPRCITGLEIERGELRLVKWWIRPNDDGLLEVARELLAPPRSVASLFDPVDPTAERGRIVQARLRPAEPTARRA